MAGLVLTQSSHPGIPGVTVWMLYRFVRWRQPLLAVSDFGSCDNFRTPLPISLIFGMIVGQLITWFNFGWFLLWPWPWICKVKYGISSISAQVWPWLWPWPWIFKVKFFICVAGESDGVRWVGGIMKIMFGSWVRWWYRKLARVCKYRQDATHTGVWYIKRIHIVKS